MTENILPAEGNAPTDEIVVETTAVDAGLLARLALIEDRPLVERAAAFAELYAELQRTLEGHDLDSAAKAGLPTATPAENFGENRV
ncbi:MAG: hypothetical protein H7248_10900 [Microbacteriaceae bacterium]|nr:hypothetical protein [Microbacteriaceae bacterium]